MKEFFGFGGYDREAEGYMSWQHLTMVTIFMVVMVLLAIFLGKKYRNETDDNKNKVLIWAAILIDGFELFKIIIMCIRSNDVFYFLKELPLYLCSIQLITIPLAAFSKGRVKEAAMDFVFIFGIVLAIIYSIVIDKVMLAGKSKVQLIIVSNYQEQIKDMIITEFDRGVTFLHSRTGYLNNEIDTILTVVDIRDLTKIKERINTIDPIAFVVVNKVSEVSGVGFTINKYKSQS